MFKQIVLDIVWPLFENDQFYSLFLKNVYKIIYLQSHWRSVLVQRLLFYGLMLYFVGHAVYLMLSTDFQSPHDNIIHVDIVYFTLDFRPNHLVVILMALQTLFNYRIFYFRLDRGLFRLLHVLLYHAETFFIENERQFVANFRRFTIKIVMLIRTFYVILGKSFF